MYNYNCVYAGQPIMAKLFKLCMFSSNQDLDWIVQCIGSPIAEQ